MIQNYFKLAIKVLGRKKFFTFVSLFGISFTLMILMLVTAFWETELGANAPMSNKDKLVYVPRLIIKKMRTDTVMEIDTTYQGSQMLVDTSYTYPSRQSSRSQSEPSYYYLDKYLKNVEPAINASMTSRNSFDFFMNSKKMTFSALMTDEHFWEIYDFTFVEGKPYQKTQVDQAEPIVIITQKAAKDYFGKTEGLLGEEMVFENRTYTVTGVIENSNGNHSFVNSEVYIPFTNIPEYVLKSEDPFGGFDMVLLVEKESDIKKVKAELRHRAEMYDDYSGDFADYNTTEIPGFTFAERYAENFYDEEEEPEKNLAMVKRSLYFLLILFVVLPILNLVNLNISRILERSSEIGVRKAFGANSGDVLFQFVFENVILTFIGGFIGFILALGLIYLINESRLLEDTILGFNFKVFSLSFLICLLFGILSGLLPAYKMSKVHIVNALKQNQR